MGDRSTSSAVRDDGRLDVSAMAAVPWEGRAVLLVDLDAFFASVEQLDHPAWRGKPVIVGGSAEKRGVVSTASYEARVFGVHSAMPSSMARKLCPDAIWTTGNFARYREVSEAVMRILFDETPHVLQVSIDEAFCDVTPTSINREHPVAIAQRVQNRVAELGVTCSIGVGTTKSVAKLASDMDKPCGLTVVMPGSELNFLTPLPVKALSGVGSATERKLKERGIETLGDLYHADTRAIVGMLGKTGQMLLDRVRGLEDDVIVPDDMVKSVSNEKSFAHDMTERADIEAAIATMAAKVGRRLRRKGLAGTTLALKVRYADLSVRSTRMQLNEPSDDEFLFAGHLRSMLDELWQPGMALRLVGVAISDFDSASGAVQMELFESDTPSDERAQERRNLLSATDKVKERFGESMLQYGRDLRLRGTGTGSSAKNPADYK